MQTVSVSSVAASSTVLEAPQFATVTFISEDGTKGSTLRVPISCQTTVRQLAKDAMQRLVLSRRSAGQRPSPAIMVTEVFVGGDGGQPMAELFTQDHVTEVVRVREEIVFMRLRAAPDGAGRPTRKHAAHTGQTVGGAEGASASAVDPSRGSSPQPPPPSALQHAPAETLAALPQALQRARSATSVVEVPSESDDEPSARKTEKHVATVKRTRDVPPPCTPERPVGSPDGKRQRQEEPPEVPPGEDTISRLREREQARLGWGPEAHRHFAPNYVSSPEKLMRRRFTKKSAAPPAASTKAVAAAKATGPTAPADGEGGVVPTVEAGPEQRPPLTKESTSRAGSRLPPTRASSTAASEPTSRAPSSSVALGWGPEAYKSFPDNYVASPDRLARAIRIQRKLEGQAQAQGKAASAKQEQAEGKPPKQAAPPASVAAPVTKPVAGVVARALQYEDEPRVTATTTTTREVGRGGRGTVGHQVTPRNTSTETGGVQRSRQQTKKEEDKEAEKTLPKGWGAEASKFFDPETYCDDPRKAKLSSFGASRLRRHR